MGFCFPQFCSETNSRNYQYSKANFKTNLVFRVTKPGALQKVIHLKKISSPFLDLFVHFACTVTKGF
jgi:hypothetical protein